MTIENQKPINKYNEEPRVCTNDFVWQMTTIKYIESHNAIDNTLGENKMTYTKQAVLMMFREGSGFTSRLADLWLVADPANRAKLEEAFASTFNKWEDRYERHLEIMVEANANL